MLGSRSLHVQSIRLDYVVASGKYRGRVTVKMVNDLGKPVSGATLYGIFTGQYQEYRLVAADSTGTSVIITSSSRTSAPTAFGFRISNITGPLPYAPADNVQDAAKF